MNGRCGRSLNLCEEFGVQLWFRLVEKLIKPRRSSHREHQRRSEERQVVPSVARSDKRNVKTGHVHRNQPKSQTLLKPVVEHNDTKEAQTHNVDASLLAQLFCVCGSARSPIRLRRLQSGNSDRTFSRFSAELTRGSFILKFRTKSGKKIYFEYNVVGPRTLA